MTPILRRLIIFLNLLTLISAVSLHILAHASLNPPPDFYSYQDFFEVSSSPRTAIYPLLLLFARYVNSQLPFSAISISVCLLILSLLLPWPFLHYLRKSYPSSSISFPSASDFVSALILVPSIIFLFVLPLSDFSYIVLSTTILLLLNCSLTVNTIASPYFRRPTLSHSVLVFSLGILWGIASLIRPVGTFFPVLLLLYTSFRLLLSHFCPPHSTKLYTLKTISILFFFLGALFTSSVYSTYNHSRFQTYNYLSIASTNTTCWRSLHARSDLTPLETMQARLECNSSLDVSTTVLQSQPNFFKYIPQYITALLRGLFDSDLISFLYYLGLYSEPALHQPASIDFLYTYDLTGLYQSIASRFRHGFLMPSIALLIASLFSSSLFILYVFRRRRQLLAIFFQRDHFLILLVYYLCVSVGSDTTGRYFAPLLFLFSILSFDFQSYSSPQ